MNTWVFTPGPEPGMLASMTRQEAGMPNHDASLVTTTVQLPHALWIRARTRAAEQRENLREIMTRALERELARPAKPRREPRPQRAAR
jgi:hypothetical protein